MLPAEAPKVPRGVERELRSAAGPGALADVLRAFGGAGQALEEGDPARAVTLLTWVKSAAGRSAAVREALGIALYQAGDFPAAHAELLAYRRLTGRQDQNHLLADCARAAGKHDRVAAYVGEMLAADVAPDRQAEGRIVLAGDKAARGDLRGGLAVLEEADMSPAQVRPWHPRLWYAAGDLAERMGDTAKARDYFEAIAAVEDDFLDTTDRLRAVTTNS